MKETGLKLCLYFITPFLILFTHYLYKDMELEYFGLFGELVKRIERKYKHKSYGFKI